MLVKCLMGLLGGNAFVLFLVILFFVSLSRPKRSAIIMLLVNISPIAILSLNPSVWPPLFSLLIFALCIIFSLAVFKVGMAKMQKDIGMSISTLLIVPLFNSIGGLIWIGNAGVLSLAACASLAVIALCATAATIWVLIKSNK